MTTVRRKFTDEQKQAIMRQADKIGITAALRENKLSYSVFARWKQKFRKNDSGEQMITMDSRTRSELKHLYEENVRLKKIIADLALELERKDEDLKKISQIYMKRQQQ